MRRQGEPFPNQSGYEPNKHQPHSKSKAGLKPRPEGTNPRDQGKSFLAIRGREEGKRGR